MFISRNNVGDVLRHARECIVTAHDAERIGWLDVGASLRRMARECVVSVKEYKGKHHE